MCFFHELLRSKMQIWKHTLHHSSNWKKSAVKAVVAKTEAMFPQCIFQLFQASFWSSCDSQQYAASVSKCAVLQPQTPRLANEAQAPIPTHGFQQKQQSVWVLHMGILSKIVFLVVLFAFVNCCGCVTLMGFYDGKRQLQNTNIVKFAVLGRPSWMCSKTTFSSSHCPLGQKYAVMDFI